MLTIQLPCNQSQMVSDVVFSMYFIFQYFKIHIFTYLNNIFIYNYNKYMLKTIFNIYLNA